MDEARQNQRPGDQGKFDVENCWDIESPAQTDLLMDQQIFDHAIQQQVSHQTPSQQPGMPHLTPFGSLATGTGMAPVKSHTYAPSFGTPQQLIQPQTPVSPDSEPNISNIEVFLPF